jgi:hypothetical protein
MMGPHRWDETAAIVLLAVVPVFFNLAFVLER